MITVYCFRGEDGICSLNIPEMLAAGLPDQEILTAWLTDLHFEVSNFCNLKMTNERDSEVFTVKKRMSMTCPRYLTTQTYLCRRRSRQVTAKYPCNTYEPCFQPQALLLALLKSLLKFFVIRTATLFLNVSLFSFALFDVNGDSISRLKHNIIFCDL